MWHEPGEGAEDCGVVDLVHRVGILHYRQGQADAARHRWVCAHQRGRGGVEEPLGLLRQMRQAAADFDPLRTVHERAHAHRLVARVADTGRATPRAGTCACQLWDKGPRLGL